MMQREGGLNEEYLVMSEDYARTMREVVTPYIEARRTNLRLPGCDGIPLFVSRYDADEPIGTVLIAHGFTENGEKFREIIHSLLRNRMSVVTWDQRGHGRSWRAPGVADLSLTHIDRFEDYVEDMAAVYHRVVRQMPGPHRVFCHSMGGAVTALFLEKHRGVVDRVAMCAPMIEPATRGVPRCIALLIAKIAVAGGRANKRMPGTKPYTQRESFESACCTGRARFEWYEDLRITDPHFQNNSPSFGWLLQALGVTRKILKPGAVEKIDARVKLYTAHLDKTVLPGPQRSFIERVQNGEHALVAGADHEIYRSDDEILFPWWRDVLSFLATK